MRLTLIVIYDKFDTLKECPHSAGRFSPGRPSNFTKTPILEFQKSLHQIRYWWKWIYNKIWIEKSNERSWRKINERRTRRHDEWRKLLTFIFKPEIFWFLTIPAKNRGGQGDSSFLFFKGTWWNCTFQNFIFVRK